MTKLWFHCKFVIREIRADCDNCRYFVQSTIVNGENLTVCSANLCPLDAQSTTPKH